jgi:hypothetical protein
MLWPFGASLFSRHRIRTRALSGFGNNLRPHVRMLLNRRSSSNLTTANNKLVAASVFMWTLSAWRRNKQAATRASNRPLDTLPNTATVDIDKAYKISRICAKRVRPRAASLAPIRPVRPEMTPELTLTRRLPNGDLLDLSGVGLYSVVGSIQ